MRSPRPRGWRAVVAAAAAALAASACSIEEPKLPTVETELVIPLGTLHYELAELVEGEDSFITGDDDILALQLAGDLDSVAVGDGLDVSVGGASVDAVLDGIELAAGSPATFAFALVQLYPPAQQAGGMDLPVPAFTFAAASPSRDLPGFTQATIRSGGLHVRLANGLPVPLGGATPPDQIQLRLLDPGSGIVLTQLQVPLPLPPAGTATYTLDLAGAVAGDSLRVELAGGSPGSAGAAVPIDPAAMLSVEVTCDALEVESAVAPIPAQTFEDTLTVGLPDSIQVIQGTLARGTLQVDLASDLPLPVATRLLVPALRTAAGSPLQLDVPLAARGSGTASADLAGCTLDFGGALGERLDVVAQASTEGSAGVDVAIQSGARVHAELLPLTLTFASVTGIVDPQGVVLDPTHVDVDMPGELDQLELENAELCIDVHTQVQMPATVDLHLEGTSDAGSMVPLDLSFELPPPEGAGLADRTFRFDRDNSQLLPFLNNLPVRLELGGHAGVGDGLSPGTITAGDALWASWRIEAPLSVALQPQEVTIDARLLDLSEDLRRQIRERVVAVSLSATVQSTLPVGARVWIGLDADSTRVYTQPRIRLGPVQLPAAAGKGSQRLAAVAVSELLLATDDIPVIADQQLLQGVTVELPGTDGSFVVLRATDRIDVRGMLRARLKLAED